MIGEEVKEVQMDVAQEGGGGGGTRRRRRTGGGRRRTRAAAAAEPQEGGAVEVGVERVEAPAPAPVGRELAPVAQTGGSVPKKSAAAPVVVIAPAKKKPAKVMLVPKAAAGAPRPVAKKTFKARKVRVTVDNSAKTVKRRRSVLGRIDAMTEEQLRAKAVAIKLSRPETVAKVPVTLLRQMLKDTYMMRGSFL